MKIQGFLKDYGKKLIQRIIKNEETPKTGPTSSTTQFSTSSLHSAEAKEPSLDKFYFQKETSGKGKIQTESGTTKNATVFGNMKDLRTQGKDTIKTKLCRLINIGERVVLLKDFPDFNVYKGYVCFVMDVTPRNPETHEYGCSL